MSDNAGRPRLSVVILCYRGGDSIVPFVAQVEQALQDRNLERYELVLVANYFPETGDRTPDIAKALAADNPRLTVVAGEKQGMMGWDVISGLNVAQGDAVALIDGDGQMPPRDIVRLFNILESGEFDFVKTFRIERHDGLWRTITSRWYNFLFRLLFPRIPFRDVNSKPKLWTRDALRKMDLQCGGWFSDGEMMLEVQRLKLSFAEIPTVFNENEWRASFVNFKTILEIFLSLLRYRFVYWFKK